MTNVVVIIGKSFSIVHDQHACLLELCTVNALDGFSTVSLSWLLVPAKGVLLFPRWMDGWLA